MGEGDDADVVGVSRVSNLFLQLTGELLTDAVDTADGRDDPEFVADAGIAVPPSVAHERVGQTCSLHIDGGIGSCQQLLVGENRLIAVVEYTRQVGLDVAVVK